MKIKINKKKITGVVCCLVLLLTASLVVPRLFFASSVGGRRNTEQFIRKGRLVDLSRFASQLHVDAEPTNRETSSLYDINSANLQLRIIEEVKQEFNNYVYSPPLPKIPLLTEPLKRPAPATASQQVAVADRGAISLSATEQQERRRFSCSFSDGSNEGVNASVQENVQKNVQFQAKLFSETKVSMEVQVKVQIYELFMLNDCEIKKNITLTALTERNKNFI